jgi:hypothetical protein
MKTIITRCAFLACAFMGGVHSDLDAKLDEATRELRAAFIRLRDIRTTSCTDWRQRQDCDLAALSNAELLLLDIASKYTRAARSSASSKDREEFEKITNAADEAREKVSHLEDLMK